MDQARKSWFWTLLWRHLVESDREYRKDWEGLKAELVDQALQGTDSRQSKGEQFKRAAEALGLRLDDPPQGILSTVFPIALTARAEFDGAKVALDLGLMGGVRLTAEGLPLKVGLRSESGFFISSPILERLGLFWKEKDPRGEVLIGDLAFDNVISVRGNPTLCRALLNAELREAVTLVIGGRDGIMEQRKLFISGFTFDSEEVLRGWAEPFIRLVMQMMARAKRGTEACLAENAVVERIWEVRAFNLAELGRHFPGTPTTLEASRKALQGDPFPWCRALAAANLGMEGIQVLKGDLQNRSLDAGLRATGLYHLGRILPPEEAEPLLIQYLSSVEWPVPSAAIAALVEGVGTVHAVPPLLELAGKGWRRAVRHEAAEAAVRIQARLEGAGAGQLSVAGTEGDEGRLSRLGERE